MTHIDRTARLRAYKETPRPAGVFGVLNTVSGRCLIGSTPNLPGMLNRQRFQLECGSHPSRQLQADYDELGADAFAFEVLEELELPKEPGYDPADDLQILLEIWTEKLAEAGGPAPYPPAGGGARLASPPGNQADLR